MLTKRVIPCLDVKNGRVVKGVNFVGLRDAGDPVELAAAYDREGADEVVEVALLEGLKHGLAHAQHLGCLRDGKTQLLASIRENLCEPRPCHLRLHLPVCHVCRPELLKAVGIEQYLARLRPVGRANHALLLEHVHNPSCPSVPHLEPPLQAGGGT